MSQTLALRLLVVLEWLILAVLLVLDSVLETRLPRELQGWAASTKGTSFAVMEVALVLGGLAFLIGLLVASVGLLLLKTWAARLYIVVTVISFPLLVLSGPNVQHAIAFALECGESTVSGMIVALLLFTDVLKPTERPRD